MGVPKFYRWISERYPCLSEVVKENQIPEFDNLYLDMNGIIHPCSHPNDDDVHFRITEEKIYENIFNYIEVLFRIIKPRKVFFMAVDGVAPRAKMNQQRGRRFRSAHEAEAKEKEALRKGEKLPEEKRFDSNCITPGTHFMARLNEQLKYFVNKKITHDRSWQGIRVFLSGHETPGEGEHKIMDFIRSEKLRTDYDANTRHCLYGLDADLMMLGLASHEPHFSLLREEVRFGKQGNTKRPTTAEETTFHLLHLSLFREYLDAEFKPIRSKISNYDAEKIIDDWVFMGFLVGNDFVPHLPDLHINHNALPMLYQAYMDVRPQMDGYLNENGMLNLANFEKYIVKLSQFDRDKFEEQFVDLSFFAEKKETGKGQAWQSERVQAKKEAAEKKLDNSFALLVGLEDDPDWPDAAPTPGAAVPANITIPSDAGNDEDDEEEDQFEVEFRQHKFGYYQQKFGIETVTKAHVFTIATEYVRALQWILHYYFNGIQSWGWYYPYHYAPYMSDLKNFSAMSMKFDKGSPFLPFQQLLGVLPAASRECLPEPYQSLMIMDSSPIIDFYPVQFEQDLNGKQQSWEAVVLIPFIDENRLLEAMAPKDKNLTAEERNRNKHSPHLMYTYDENLNFNYPSSCVGHFPDIAACHCKCEEIHKAAFQHDPSKLERGLRKGVKLGVYFPGFPTLHHLSYTTELTKAEVKVFQQNARGESMILTIKAKNSDSVELEVIANELLGKTIYAEWPHLKEVRVIAVASPGGEYRYELESAQRGSKATEQISYKRVPMTEDDRIQWVRDVKSIAERYHKRKGVKIGKTEVLVYACPLMGRRYICGHSGVITLEKQWSSNPVTYAYQMTVKDIAVHDSTFKQFKTLEEIFPKDSSCFMLGTPNYGCEGKVLEVEDGRVRVLFTIPFEPTFDHIKNKMHQYDLEYYPGYIMAKRLGISSLLVSRLTGTVFMERGNKEDSIYQPVVGNRIAIGLNLKFNKANEEVPGYTRKGDDERGTWLYSTKLEEVLKEYFQKFPELIEYVANHAKEDTYYEADIFGEDSGRLKEFQDWLKSLDCMKVGKVQCGHKNVSESAVKLIEEDLANMVEGKRKSVRKMKLFIRPHLLYRPLDHQGNLIPDPEADYQLLDRVVNVREGYTVPLGLKGIVIGIQQSANILDSLYDVIFDEEFQGGLNIRSKGARGYRMPPTALINISFGWRKESGQHRTGRPTAVVKPQFSDSPRTPHTQSPSYYSNIVGKLGSGGQRSQDNTPRNQRGNSRSGYNQTPEQFYTPRMQFDSNQYNTPYSTPYSTPYQNTPPLAQSSTKNRSGANRCSGRTPSQMGQEETPSFTLLTKSGQKKVEPSKETNQTQPQNTKHSSKRHNGPEDSTPSRPVKETSSNYARVLKTDGDSNASARKSKSAPDQRQQNSGQSSQNLTPKSQNSDPNLPKERSKSSQEVDEFANLWKSLQGAESDNSAPNTPSKNRTIQRQQEPSDESSMQINNEDIPLKPKGVMDLTAYETERMSPNTFTKTGTEELCRLLNITKVSDQEPTPPASESSTSNEASPKSDPDVTPATPATPSYGIPLTVDQLFSGVLPPKDPPSTQKVISQPPGLNQPQPQQPQHTSQPHPHQLQHTSQPQPQQPQHTLPITIPGAKPLHPYPVVPIASPQTPPNHPGIIPVSPLVVPGASPLVAPGASPYTASSSSSDSPVMDPRTPPRTSQYEGPPVMAYQGPQVIQQQFRMPGPVIRGPPMVNRAPLPPPGMSGPSYMQILSQWCHQHKLPQPLFEFYGNQNTGTVKAAVHLPNGPKIVGPDGVNQPMAAEMAAHIFLNKLDPSKFGMPGMRGPAHGPIHGSPRQAPSFGSPHQALHGQPPGSSPHGSPRQAPLAYGSPHGSPHQPRYPLFPEQHGRPIRPTIGPASGVGLQWQQHQRMPTRPSVPPGHVGIPPGSPQQGPGSPQVVFHGSGPNPFVPLQVTRKLTPRKSQDDDTDIPASPKVAGSFPLPTTTNQAQIDQASMMTPPKTYPVAPESKEICQDNPKQDEVKDEKTEVEKLDSAIVSASLESSDSKKSSSKTRRKPSKAKLAINFGGMN